MVFKNCGVCNVSYRTELSSAFSESHALIGGNLRNSVFAASGLIARGKIELSDMRRNIERLSNQVRRSC